MTDAVQGVRCEDDHFRAHNVVMMQERTGEAQTVESEIPRRDMLERENVTAQVIRRRGNLQRKTREGYDPGKGVSNMTGAVRDRKRFGEDVWHGKAAIEQVCEDCSERRRLHGEVLAMNQGELREQAEDRVMSNSIQKRRFE